MYTEEVEVEPRSARARDDALPIVMGLEGLRLQVGEVGRLVRAQMLGVVLEQQPAREAQLLQDALTSQCTCAIPLCQETTVAHSLIIVRP